MSATVEADVSSNGNHNSGTTPLETAALAYASGGLHVFPLHSIALDGHCTCGNSDCKSPGKHPRTRHGVSDATTDNDQIIAWWKQWPGANIGVATGHGGLYVIDLDGPEGNNNWNQLTDNNPTPQTRSVATGNGRHLWFLTDHELGNSASRIAPGIDTRGRGGYVVAPPSVHAAGTTYSFENPGSPLANLPTWIVEHLTRRTTPTPPDTTRGDSHALRRLEGAAGKVAIAPEGQRNTVLNWAAYTAGRLIAAGRLDEPTARDMLTVAAQRAGLTPTEIHPTITSGIAGGEQDPDHDTAPDSNLQPLTVINHNDELGDDTDTPRSSWAPVDGTDYIDGTWEPPAPTQLARDDGTALLYPGRINLLFGESEAGKGWVALHAIQQALARGDTVLYIDFEDYPDTIYARLKLLGLNRTQLAPDRFAYIRPDHGLDEPGRHALGNTVTHLNPDLVVLDGITGAMSLHQFDTNASTDVDQFYSLLGEPLARHGAAVVFIDHVTKSSENRGKGPIGSQHKRARVSGASYEITSVLPIAPGRAGKLRIRIDKDRLGAVRAGHPTQAGEFHLDSTSPAPRSPPSGHPGQQTATRSAPPTPWPTCPRPSRTRATRASPGGVSKTSAATRRTPSTRPSRPCSTTGMRPVRQAPATHLSTGMCGGLSVPQMPLQ